LQLHLVDALKANPGDPVLAHVVTYALIRADVPFGSEVANLIYGNKSQTLNKSPHVRRALAIAEAQRENSMLTSEQAADWLADEAPLLQQTALEVIARRPGWGAATLSLLKTWVREPELSADRANALRAFLLAQLGDPAVQGFVKQVLEDREIASVVRGLVWEVVQRSTLATWPEQWNSAVAAVLQGGDPETQLVVLRILQRLGLGTFDAELTNISRDATQSPLLRAEALAALGPRMNGVADEQFQSLRKLLAKDAATADKMAAARALAVMPLDGDQLEALASDLDAAGPLVASTLLKAFERSKDDNVGVALVGALRQSSVAETLSPDELSAIVRRYSPMVQQLALPLIKKLGIDPAAQQARLAELSPLIADGNPKLGEQLFFGKKANCSACHAVAGKGARIGPDLSRIGQSRTGRDLLEAIVYPSASFVNGYRPYVVATNDGKVIDGVISAETTDAIALRTKDLQEIRVRRDQIDELRESSTSIMPKGLDTQLSADELRHLLAYLQSRR
jgi:putative heme-binding domain-containing protein